LNRRCAMVAYRRTVNGRIDFLIQRTAGTQGVSWRNPWMHPQRAAAPQ
jgi:hypothetical protein